MTIYYDYLQYISLFLTIQKWLLVSLELHCQIFNGIFFRFDVDSEIILNALCERKQSCSDECMYMIGEMAKLKAYLLCGNKYESLLYKCMYFTVSSSQVVIYTPHTCYVPPFQQIHA